MVVSPWLMDPKKESIEGQDYDVLVLYFNDDEPMRQKTRYPWWDRKGMIITTAVPSITSIVMESSGQKLSKRQRKALSDDITNLIRSYGIRECIKGEMGVYWKEVLVPEQYPSSMTEYLHRFVADLNVIASKYDAKADLNLKDRLS